MPTLSLDSQSRLQIAKAILDTVGKGQAVRVINLCDGSMLLMLSHCGHLSFDLVSDAEDLFNPHLMVDVSAQVEADLKSHRDWSEVMTR